MTPRHKIAFAVSGMTLIAFAVAAGGCGSVFETNQQACARLFDYFRACVPDDGSVPPGVDLDALVAATCALIPEDSECNYSAVTDCMIRNTTCNTIGVGAPPAACVDLAVACAPGTP
jgi:hypothetical protein